MVRPTRKRTPESVAHGLSERKNHRYSGTRAFAGSQKHPPTTPPPHQEIVLAYLKKKQGVYQFSALTSKEFCARSSQSMLTVQRERAATTGKEETGKKEKERRSTVNRTNGADEARGLIF